MIHFILISIMIVSLFAFSSPSYAFERDVIKTSDGELEITFIGHGTLMFKYNEKIITENTPEMKQLKGIDVAFLPMNLPYTMTPEMVADAALAFKPKILYPYHFGDTDSTKLVELLKAHPEIDVRIRNLQ